MFSKFFKFVIRTVCVLAVCLYGKYKLPGMAIIYSLYRK